MRDRRAVARYAGLTGAPDESGGKEQGLAKAGNARVRRGMIQLAWRFLRFQKHSALAQWYQARTADHRGATRKTMIVALARKLLIALWRFVTIGEPLDGDPASGKLTNLWRIISLLARRSLLASTTGTAGRRSEVAGTGC